MATNISDPRITALVQSATEAQSRGDTRRAVAAYEQALTINPAQPVVLNALGMIALRAGDHGTAQEWFARGTRADPAAGPLWLNLAAAHRLCGDGAGERAALEEVLAIDQRNVMGNFRLAELLDRQGQESAAIPHWQGLATMLAGLPERSGDVARILATAEARLAAHGAALGTAIDTALAARREALAGHDRRRVDACVDAMLGRRRIFRNECHGLHFPFLPADEFFDRAHFPWLGEIEAQTDAIRAEVQALMTDGEGMEPYVALAKGTPDNKWSALDNKLDWSAFYLWRYGERQEAACARCPVTAAALARLPLADMPGRGPSVFFSILQPHTRLPAHSGVSNVRAIVHLPLIVPPGCGFRVGGETREWREGEAFAFDDTIEHEAWNDSDAPRAVLIFDVWNPHLTLIERDMLGTVFTTMDASGHAAARGAGVVD